MTKMEDTFSIAASKAQHCSRALFRDIRYTRTRLYTRECGLPRAISLVGVSRCDCSTIATLSCSHGLHPSGPSFPSLPATLSIYLTPFSLAHTLSFSFSRSACLSHPLLSLSSHPLDSSLAIISPPPTRLATPEAAKCLFETHPSRRHFPANRIDAPGPGRESAESPAALTALTALTLSLNTGRRSPAGRKFEKLAHDRPIGPRILVEKSRHGAFRRSSLCIARMRVFDATECGRALEYHMFLAQELRMSEYMRITDDVEERKRRKRIVTASICILSTALALSPFSLSFSTLRFVQHYF